MGFTEFFLTMAVFMLAFALRSDEPKMFTTFLAFCIVFTNWFYRSFIDDIKSIIKEYKKKEGD